MPNGEAPIVIEQTFDCSVPRLWSAITELDELRLWFFDIIPDFQAKEGFATSFMVKATEHNFDHHWKVVEVIDQKKLVINWTFSGFAGSSNSIFEIEPTDGGSKLTLTAIVLEEHPQHIPEFRRESGVEGWKYFIQGNLKNYIEQNK